MSGRTRPGELVRTGSADHPGRDQHDPGRFSPHPGRQLHIHGVLQDDLLGDRVRRAARHVPVASALVVVRSGRVHVQKTAAAFVHRQVPATAVLHTAPVTTPSHGTAAGLRQEQTIPRHVGRAQVKLDPEAGQRHGSGHVGGLQREQLVQVPEEEEGSGGGRGANEKVHGRMEEGYRPFDVTAENRLS